MDEEDNDTWAVFLEIRHWIAGNLTHKGHFMNTDVIFRLVTTRSIPATGTPEISGWQIVDENLSTRVAKYAKAPDLYNFEPYLWRYVGDFTKYLELKQIPCGSDYDKQKYILITTGEGGNNCINIRKKITEDRPVNIIWEFGRFNFNRNRRLLSVIRYLLMQIAPETVPLEESQLSEFFSADINYVTGLENKLKDILIAQKSDILSYNSSEAATKAMLSLKKLLSELNAMWDGDLFWFINVEGKFQLEHRAYFETLGTVDLLQEKYAPYLNGKRAYEYLIEKMPRFQKLTFSNFLNEDFYQGIIEYQGACVNHEEGQDTEEKTVSLFTTDLEHLLTASGSDKNGFVLLVHANGEVLKEAGAITGEMLINAHLAAANLVNTYSLYGRILYTGLVNNKPKVFRSIRKTIKQVELTVPSCCGDEFGTFAEYITNIGEKGELISSELNFKTETITLNIAFDKVIKQTYPRPDDIINPDEPNNPQNPENPENPLPEERRQFSNQFSKQFS